MNPHRSSHRPAPLRPPARLLAAGAGLLLLVLLAPGAASAQPPPAADAPEPAVVTDADVAAHLFAPLAVPQEMQGPRMKGDDGYNSDYIFGMSRAIGNSTLVPAVKPLFWLITVPLDLAFLPFAAIGGLFA